MNSLKGNIQGGRQHIASSNGKNLHTTAMECKGIQQSSLLAKGKQQIRIFKTDFHCEGPMELSDQTNLCSKRNKHFHLFSSKNHTLILAAVCLIKALRVWISARSTPACLHDYLYIYSVYIYIYIFVHGFPSEPQVRLHTLSVRYQGTNVIKKEGYRR